MVVAGRLAWARERIVSGVPAFITVGGAACRDRGKVKLVIDHDGAVTSPMTRTLLVDALDSIARRATHTTTVDRGHRHTSGTSEICIWFSALQTRVAAGG